MYLTDENCGMAMKANNKNGRIKEKKEPVFGERMKGKTK